jgi:hypothetical protein
MVKVPPSARYCGSQMALRVPQLVRIVGLLMGMGTVVLLGCGTTQSAKTFTPHHQFKGNIFVAVTENTGAHEAKQLYRIALNEGISAPTNDPINFVESGNSGAIGSCSLSPDVLSPNKEYIAKCEGPLPFVSHRGSPDRLTVVQRSTGKVVLREPIFDRNRIKALLWSPDSQIVAVLISWEHFGAGPGDLMARFFGHPVPYHIYTVELYRILPRAGVMEVASNKIITAGPPLVIQDFTGSIRYGFATFLRWDNSK